MISVLKNHNKIIEYEFLEKQLKLIKDQEIILCIYSVKEKYTEALNLIVEGKDVKALENDDPIFDKIQKFCRNSPDPPVAFSFAYKMMGSEFLLGKNLAFLEQNIQYSDPVSTLEMIPDDQKLNRSICNIIRVLYNLLLNRELSLDNQIAVSRSIETDTNYRLSRAQSSHCTIDSTTKCSGCGDLLGNAQFYMAPTKEVYHTRCKPDHVD